MVELEAHRRHVAIALITTVVPSFMLVGLFLVSGQAFWLAPIVLFALVGALNYFLFESRPVPRKVRLGPGGIWVETREGTVRNHAWSEVREVRDHVFALQGRRRMELHFKDDQEPLHLYPYAMELTICNDRPAASRFSDHVVVTGVVWDRPMKLARRVLQEHVPGFRA
jgi:hypothetical protein